MRCLRNRTLRFHLLSEVLLLPVNAASQQHSLAKQSAAVQVQSSNVDPSLSSTPIGKELHVASPSANVLLINGIRLLSSVQHLLLTIGHIHNNVIVTGKAGKESLCKLSKVSLEAS